MRLGGSLPAFSPPDVDGGVQLCLVIANLLSSWAHLTISRFGSTQPSTEVGPLEPRPISTVARVRFHMKTSGFKTTHDTGIPRVAKTLQRMGESQRCALMAKKRRDVQVNPWYILSLEHIVGARRNAA